MVAFRPYGKMIWMLTVLASADASRYVFRNESVRPFSPFEVKVGVFNNKGEGPFSPTTVVYSAEEGTMLLQFQDVDFIYLFIYLWLLWVFVAAVSRGSENRGNSLDVVCGLLTAGVWPSPLAERGL